MSHQLAVVIPTIGRYAELRRLLESLALQTQLPDQVLMVGEGEGTVEVAGEFPQLSAEFIRLPGSSICAKRNRGAQAVRSGIDFIVFLDDDVALDAACFETVMSFWDSAPKDLGGTCLGLNVLNDSPRSASWLKKKLAARLALYSSTKGAVARSGFHVPYGDVAEPVYVSWLPSGCVVYPRHVVEKYRFDEVFRGYSYLEDLDLSYRVGKEFRLAVVPQARCDHLPSPIGRPDPFLFGKKEVMNRLYFVSKHLELSRPLCCLGLCFRALMNLFDGLSRLDPGSLRRAAGNVAGLLLAARSGARPV